VYRVRGLLRCGRFDPVFVSYWGQNPLLPHRNIDARFTSITGHKGPLADRRYRFFLAIEVLASVSLLNLRTCSR
jgi:hypothetical protein